ncbi:MAG: Bug family tripartite tricarboxylate transporter substrate binding protein [Lacisediminimonas sp.]|jgi:tripartite-type tricarboxylate transporter receptor subunit TctC|nr:Bug family tripartite tricarboxylate transporter substrate binding protein [Lacisediminimonas sp.]
MTTTRRTFTQSLLASAALSFLGLPHAARAQGSLDAGKILVGFPPGGTTDALSRRIADKLRGGYATTMLVENKPGAGGQIAISTLKNAPSDGSVLLLTPSSMLSVYPFTYAKLPYKLDDLAPVSVACFFSLGFGVGPAVPDSVKDIKGFLAWAKANPDKANFGSPAAGSIPHLTGALLNKITKSDLKHIPYRGSAPGIQDLLGGQISAMSSPVGDYLPYLKTGKLRILATSGPKRSPFTPDVPTFKEQGIDIAVREWYGFFLPAKATAEARQRAAAYLQPALAQKDVIDSLAQVGMEVQSSTPDQLAEWLQADAAQWRGIVKEIGFSADS